VRIKKSSQGKGGKTPGSQTQKKPKKVEAEKDI
jgi:hypothetical protein